MFSGTWSKCTHTTLSFGEALWPQSLSLLSRLTAIPIPIMPFTIDHFPFWSLCLSTSISMVCELYWPLCLLVYQSQEVTQRASCTIHKNSIIFDVDTASFCDLNCSKQDCGSPLARCECVSGVSSELIYFNESKGADGNPNSMCGFGSLWMC